MEIELPNYYLADLPPEAVLTPKIIGDACQSLKSNREQYLAGRSTQSIIYVLEELGRSWLEEDNPYRKIVLKKSIQETGFPEAIVARGLNAFFEQLNSQSIEELIVQDLGNLQRLDMLTPASPYVGRRNSIAVGPELIVHITAGNIPNPTLMSMALGLLTRSAQFIKCATGTSLIPRLFAHSLREIEPKLASCIEIAEWKGGTIALEEPLFEAADCITATGSDETLEEIKNRVPISKRFIAYGNRVSFAYIAREMLTKYQVKNLLKLLVDDIAVWNQLGCLSPHLVYIEKGGATSAENFAEMLAQELANREATEPRGDITLAESCAIASRRSFYEVRASFSSSTKIWCSEDSTSWTVVYEEDPRFQLSCLNRFVYVKSVYDIDEVLKNTVNVQRILSTVGLAAPTTKARDIVMKLARWGVSRVCPIGSMQKPPFAWHHDGRPSLGDLIRWTDWEM